VVSNFRKQHQRPLIL